MYRFLSVRKTSSRVSSTLFEMKAYIFNGDKGDDIEVGEIPADLKDQAEDYTISLSSSVLT